MADLVKNISNKIYDRLISEGFTHNAALGIIANFAYESDGFTAFEEYGFNRHGNKGAGIAMWTDDPKGAPRRTMYERWMKDNDKDLESIDHQLDYFLYELENHPNNMPKGRHMSKENLNKAKSVREAADIFMKGYEAPADQSSDHLDKRLARIKDFDRVQKDDIDIKGPIEKETIKKKDNVSIEVDAPRIIERISMRSIVDSVDRSLSTMSIPDQSQLEDSIRRVVDETKKWDTQYTKAAEQMYDHAFENGKLETEKVIEEEVNDTSLNMKPSNEFEYGGELQPNGRVTSFKRPEDIKAQNNTTKI